MNPECRAALIECMQQTLTAFTVEQFMAEGGPSQAVDSIIQMATSEGRRDIAHHYLLHRKEAEQIIAGMLGLM